MSGAGGGGIKRLSLESCFCKIGSDLTLVGGSRSLLAMGICLGGEIVSLRVALDGSLGGSLIGSLGVSFGVSLGISFGGSLGVSLGVSLGISLVVSAGLLIVSLGNSSMEGCAGSAGGVVGDVEFGVREDPGEGRGRETFGEFCAGIESEGGGGTLRGPG